MRVLLSSAVVWMLLGGIGTSPAHAQIVVGYSQGTGLWARQVYAFPPRTPARSIRRPSMYSAYGARRLEGRVVAMPLGTPIPSTPSGVDRYTIANFNRPVPSVVVAPAGSGRYSHSMSRASYRGGGYQRGR